MERQHFHALDVAKPRRELRRLRQIGQIVGQTRHQHEANPHRPPARREPPGEFERGSDLLPREREMTRGIPRLDPEHHEIDGIQLGVGQPVAVEAVCLNRRVNAHLLCGRQQLGREPTLHQRLTAAQREAARHHLEAVAVLAQFLRRLRHRYRHAVAERPGVGVVAVLAAPHAACGPRHDAHARAIDGRTGRVGVQEPHVAAGQRLANALLGNGIAQMDPEFKRALRLE